MESWILGVALYSPTTGWYPRAHSSSRPLSSPATRTVFSFLSCMDKPSLRLPEETEFLRRQKASERISVHDPLKPLKRTTKIPVRALSSRYSKTVGDGPVIEAPFGKAEFTSLWECV